MILNKNNWFAMYYNWIYGEYPEDVCSFFWGSVMAILLAPFMLPGKLLISMQEDNEWDQYKYGLQTVIGFGIWIFYLIICGAGLLVMDMFGYEPINVWSFLTLSFAIGVITLALLFLLIWGMAKLFSNTGSILPETHITDNVIDFVAGIKGKYCTRITWTDNKYRKYHHH